MGKHLKRLAAPKSWKIPRKEKTWIVKPRPGPHKGAESLPLLLIVRDFLDYADTSREAKRIINEGKVLVNKVVRRDYKFPVGLMDIIEIPEAKERKIVLLDKRGRLILKKLLKKNANFKLSRILNKTIVKGGNIQLNLHDGRNILVKAEEDVYKTKDTLLLDLKKGTIAKHVPYKEGNLAFITGGSHRAVIARIEEIKKIRSPEPNVVVLSTDDTRFETIEDYVFVMGEKELLIPEVAK